MARLLVVIVSIGLAVAPIGAAFAGEQVLEIPQVISVPAKVPSARKHRHLTSTEREAHSNVMPAADADATPGEGGPTDSWDRVVSNEKLYAPDPNVGSISDYENQPGENAQPAGIAFGSSSGRNEPPSSMTTNLIVGGLIVGLVAVEIASHHHHR